MTLREWKKQHRYTDRQLADLVGTTAGNINHVINNHRAPSLNMCLKIIKATGGQVTLFDLRPELNIKHE